MTDVSKTCAVVIFSVKVSCITSVDGIKLVIGLIGQLSRGVGIGVTMSVSSYKVRVVVVFTKRCLGSQSRLAGFQATESKTSCARLVKVRTVLAL